MAQNKEQLDKLLQFIAAIIKEPGNEEFTKKLRALVSPLGETNAFRVTQIEKYLGLDFKLDNIQTKIDYSFIDQNNIRFQLESDYREMLRYRFGVRSHITDFLEYCRFATLQIEMLINYFYCKRFDNIKDCIANIKKYNPTAKIEDAKSIIDISLASKLWAFEEEFQVSYKIKNCIDKVRDARNFQSHRNKTIDEDEFIKSVYEQIKQFPLYDGVYIDFGALKQNMVLNNIYNSSKVKNLYKKYEFYIWKKDMPFSEVEQSLTTVAQIIKENS